MVFTPEEVSERTPIFDDHPYSNLLFMASSRQWLSADAQSVTRSALLVGLLGTNAAKVVQQGLHDLIDVDTLTDNGASLPAGVAVVGNRLVLTVA